jgi:hypothetical protein
MSKLKKEKLKCPECNYILKNDKYCESCGFWISKDIAKCGICDEELKEYWAKEDKEGNEYFYYRVCKTCGKILCEHCCCENIFEECEHECKNCRKEYVNKNICPECDDMDCRLCKWSDDYNPTQEELDRIEGREAFYNLTHDEYGNIECGWEHLFDD